MNVTHLRSVTVAASDPLQLADFYEQVWGLAKVADDNGAVYLRGTGPEHHILEIVPASRSRVIGYALGLESRAAVDEAARDMRRYPGVVIVDPPAPRSGPGGGYALTLSDVDGRLVELSADVEMAGPARHNPAVAPVKISHVVLNSPSAEDHARFLVEVLGFSLADEMPHMLFFRCNRDHHSIAVSRAPHASLNHIAFEVPTAADVRHGVDRVGESVPMIWGPNRHGPGHNVFGYFRAPNGQVIEYTAEVEQVDDTSAPEPRMWLPEDSVLYDEWADPATLRPTADAREVMLGIAEPELAPPSTLGPAQSD